MTIFSSNSNEEIDLNKQILLKLIVRTVLLTYQIDCFDSTDHYRTAFLSDDVVIYVRDIVALYQKSNIYRLAFSETDNFKRIRDNFKRSASKEYSVNLVVNRSSLTAAVRKFRIEVASLNDNDVYKQWLHEYLDRNIIELSHLSTRSYTRFILEDFIDSNLDDTVYQSEVSQTQFRSLHISENISQRSEVRRFIIESVLRDDSLSHQLVRSDARRLKTMNHSESDQKDLIVLTDAQRLMLENMMTITKEVDRQKEKEIREARAEKISENVARRDSSESISDRFRRKFRVEAQRDSKSWNKSASRSHRDSTYRWHAKSNKARRHRHDSESFDNSDHHREHRRRDDRNQKRRTYSSSNYSDNSDYVRSCQRFKDRFRDRFNQKNNKFRSEEIDFFNSHLKTREANSDDIIELSDKIYYRSVHLFIDALKNVDNFKVFELVRRNLNKCLKDISQKWYIAQLIDVKREYVRKESEIERWEMLLLRCFKKTQSFALKALEEKRYTISDARNDKETFEFVTNIVRHVREADIITIFAQLIWAWNRIDSDLRDFIRRLTDRITIMNFIEKLENVKKVSHDKYFRRSQANNQARRFQDNYCFQKLSYFDQQNSNSSSVRFNNN